MKAYFYRLNTFQRILLYFIIVIVVTSLILTGLIYRHSTIEIKKQYQQTLEHIVSNASHQTDLYFDELITMILPTMADIDIKRFISIEYNDENNHGSSYYTFYQYHSEVKNKLQNLFTRYEDNIRSIFVVGNNNQLAFANFTGRSSRNSITYEEILEENPEGYQINFFLADSASGDGKVIRIVGKINGLDVKSNHGLLVVEVNPDSLESLWGSSQLKDGTALWVFDHNHKIYYHPDNQKIGDQLTVEEIAKFEQTEDYFTHAIDKEKIVYHYKTSPQTNLTIVATTPESSVYTPLKGLNKIVIIAITLSLMIAILFSILFAKSIVKPIKKVQTGMQAAETENWVYMKELEGTDEMSSLIKSYNKMIHKVSKLIEDLYIAELKEQKDLIEKKELELQALESQINPHFLYNTLETISSKAILNDDIEISDMVVALSMMLRYSVRNLEVVTLEQEIAHIKSYIMIEQYRFEKRIQFKFDIEDDLYDKKIVKLMLQPLVENALEHGFHKRNDGQLIIRAEKNVDHLRITVMDNGRGIPPKILKQINNSLSDNGKSSFDKRSNIGLINVNRRIQLIFGDEYGININSSINEGTKILMDLPVTDHL